MIEERRFHYRLPDPTNGPVRFRPRGIQPEVKIAATDRQPGEIDWLKLTSAATREAEQSAKRGKPLVVSGECPSIKSPALRLLAQQAKRDLARLHANRRADAHRGQEG